MPVLLPSWSLSLRLRPSAATLTISPRPLVHIARCNLRRPLASTAAMAHRDTAPYAPQDPQVVGTMVNALQAHAGGKGRDGYSVKQHTFELPCGRKVFSWKFNDWDYKKTNLPTYARGLFTYKNKFGNHEIAVRGYDKFFNHGEVRTTEWRYIKRSTRGPYVLSVKENGCIIFVSGLEDGSLLVCSKHSTGARDDVALSHACAGEKWVERHIATVGRSKEELARTLRAMNATLVAELCDDEFEEHVLAYTPEQAGLYVHGLNLNLPEFVTYPAHLVDKFADEWGMKKVIHVVENDIKEVKTFLDHVAETGNYDGRDTEGFVIRCQTCPHEGAPYVDWFFKYKFEEPYLMYRQWRECTKALIAGKLPRYKKHAEITQEYLDFARRKFVQNPGLAKEYALNHGIIKLRDEFLAFRGTTGADIIRQELAQGPVEKNKAHNNFVLVPVATIGCGKTTLALALVKLFGWGHYQNDNVTAKKGRPKIFADTISSLLATNPVVIADRNNHQKRERDQIMDSISRTVPDARYVALHYVHDRSNYHHIREATRKRVLDRGDNHQTIQAGSKSTEEVVEIMEGFMHRFQPVNPSDAPDHAFDLVINLDPTLDTRDNLETVIAKMFETYPNLFQGKEMPTNADMDAAIEWAMHDYKPDFKMDLSRSSKDANKNHQNMLQTKKTSSRNTPEVKSKKEPDVIYFGVFLDATRVNSILEAIFADKDADTAHMYRRLKQHKRVQDQFHVTLIHRASSAGNRTYWDKLKQVYAEHRATGSLQPELGKCHVHLERLIWDDRIMSFVVRLDGAVGSLSDSMPVTEPLTLTTVNPVAHITVGTANSQVKPMESNALLQQWLTEGSGGETGIGEVSVSGNVVLEGSVRGVQARP